MAKDQAKLDRLMKVKENIEQGVRDEVSKIDQISKRGAKKEQAVFQNKFENTIKKIEQKHKSNHRWSNVIKYNNTWRKINEQKSMLNYRQNSKDSY